MKLLLDQNSSHRLVRVLADLYPGLLHVRDIGLQAADDNAIWVYARDYGLAIVSKDADFRQRSFLNGPPPKLIWVRLGNCSTHDVEKLLRDHHGSLITFDGDSASSFLALG